MANHFALLNEKKYFFQSFADSMKFPKLLLDAVFSKLSLKIDFAYIFFMFPRKFYERRNNSKVNSIETLYLVIAHLLS